MPKRFYDLYPTDRLPPVKLHPRDGYERHPWVDKQNAFMDSEAKFTDEEERLRAIASYFGLCSWLDHNVGEILGALDAAGLGDTTTVAYTSDHGDNVGARGLWGKSNLYEESVAVPLIVSDPDGPRGVCDTPVSLLDLSTTIASHFDCPFESEAGARSLIDIATAPAEPERVVFSEYHAAGAVSGAFMLRKGRWKYNYYEGFAPELFDLENDPEECIDLAADPASEPVLAAMHAEMLKICNPVAVDAQAFADQAAMIERHGGREAALKLGAPGATPPPVLAN